MTSRHAEGQSQLALRFFCVSALVFTVGALVGFALVRFAGEPFGSAPAYPWAFAVSTSLLLTGSVLLQRGISLVRRERQLGFQKALIAAVVVGMLFIGVQSYALWSLYGHQDPGEVQTGSAAFVFVFTGMHGVHFTIALLFLVFVMLRARAQRYDHEYHWGVIVATTFWHLLGAAWLAILMAIVISMRALA